ncbi:hypothetical protein HPP92_017037 [Vanilla planifolia]|uniref:PB1 domain-containing protein n=1 Tax=Vanilla planifolia TaxID=51239 RepID=A0A835QMB0_VANPL|nr:hypothetical protein HPP92_017037 [Vanilla planifolia]
MNSRVLQSPHMLQQKLQQPQMSLSDIPSALVPALSNNALPSANLLTAAGTHSVLTDDIPSCSASPSTNNGVILPQHIIDKISHHKMVTSEKASLSPVTMLNPCSVEPLPQNSKLAKDLLQLEQVVKPSVPIPEQQGQGVASQVYLNNAAQTDYLDTSSSATSACPSQKDGSLQHSLPFSSFGQPSLLRDAMPDNAIQGNDPRNNTLFGVNIDDSLGIPMSNDPLFSSSIGPGKFQTQLPGGVANYAKDAQQELSSSMASQSFGVADMALNSIDSTITDSSILNRNSWGPAQFPRMRTYTKVYKRGAVGRSLDITRYSGYDELKRDLARMFSIEGQLEDWKRIDGSSIC